MKHTLLLAALVSMIGLTACEKSTPVPPADPAPALSSPAPPSSAAAEGTTGEMAPGKTPGIPGTNGETAAVPEATGPASTTGNMGSTGATGSPGTTATPGTEENKGATSAPVPAK